MRYTYAEQAAHYRQAARDRGCTCPDLMAPHTHLLECPLYEVPGGVPEGLHDHRDSQAADVIDGASPPDPRTVSGRRETMPGEGGSHSPQGERASYSPGAWEREEDHALERHVQEERDLGDMSDWRRR